MAQTATDTFEIGLTAGAPELDGAALRPDFTKSFGGELAGITGALRITMEQDGTHRYALGHEL